MSNLTTARPFAESAFAVAKATEQLLPWSVGLEALAIAYCDARMRRVLNNPSFDRAQQVVWLVDLAQSSIAIADVAEAQKGDFSNMFANFVRDIALDRNFSLLPAVAQLFQD